MLATVYNRGIQTSPVPPLRQAYLPDTGELQLGADEYLLGIIRHGAVPHASPIPDGVPTASLALETLDGTHGQEAWFTNSPVSYGTADGIAYAHSGSMLFGVLRCSAEEPGASAQEAYSRIIGLVRSFAAERLLRLWNYFPAINSLQDGLERYRRFCMGRHAALAAAGYALTEDLPAASAIGTREGDFVIIFLAGAGIATQIENPRQVSAFRYPAVYGPRSPSFSRAIRFSVSDPEQASLLISGTASILGHETVHVGDPIRQCATTLDNLRTLLARVGEDAPDRLGRRASWKIYLRHREDLDKVRDYLGQALDSSSPVLYLAGDICRTALLLEIEGLVELGGTARPMLRYRQR